MASVKKTNSTDIAAKISSAITEAIARSNKFGTGEGKVNVHVHVGDVILIGFDEAIDAEEWGMRENNTEIVGTRGAKGRAAVVQDADALANKNRKISRSINFSKGALTLNAIENSEPATKRATKRVAKRATKGPTKRISTKRVSKKTAPARK